MRRIIIAIVACLFAVSAEAQLIRAPSGGPPVTPIPSEFTNFSYRMITAIFNDTTLLDIGLVPGTDTFGTTTAVNMTVTDYGRFERVRRTSATAANSAAGFSGTVGSASIYGPFAAATGYKIVFRIGFPQAFAAGQRMWCGTAAKTGALTGASSFVGVANLVYFGFNAGEATWQFCTHTNAGARSCADLSLVIGTTGFFSFSIETTDGTSYHYKMTRDDFAAGPSIIAEGDAISPTFGLPSTTAELRPVCFASNVATNPATVIVEPSLLLIRLPYF